MGSLWELTMSPFHIYEGERQFGFFFIEIKIHRVTLLFPLASELAWAVWTGRTALSFQVLIEHCNEKSIPRDSIAAHLSIKEGNSSSCMFWQWSQHSSTFLGSKRSAKTVAHAACTMPMSTLSQPVGQTGSALEEPLV